MGLPSGVPGSERAKLRTSSRVLDDSNRRQCRDSPTCTHSSALPASPSGGSSGTRARNVARRRASSAAYSLAESLSAARSCTASLEWRYASDRCASCKADEVAVHRLIPNGLKELYPTRHRTNAGLEGGVRQRHLAAALVVRVGEGALERDEERVNRNGTMSEPCGVHLHLLLNCGWRRHCDARDGRGGRLRSGRSSRPLR
eukprot:scaffold257280_cov32-Tisochrysis_lutea.AAC.1